ncbi:MAG: hypothetical protein AAFP02_25685, partial [Bacteroidota bacterium]
ENQGNAPSLSSDGAMAGSEQSGAGLWRWLCSVRVFAPLFAKKGHTFVGLLDYLHKTHLSQ